MSEEPDLLRAHRRAPGVAADEVGGSATDLVNPWGVAMFRTLLTIEPRTAAEQAAYGKWLDQQSDRRPPGRTGHTAPKA